MLVLVRVVRLAALVARVRVPVVPVQVRQARVLVQQALVPRLVRALPLPVLPQLLA